MPLNDSDRKHTIYVLREVAEMFSPAALSPGERRRLDQHYAALSYGPVAVTYAHAEVYGPA